jgi:hypothetical protein
VNELETLLRDTFRDREHVVAGDKTRLLPAARARRTRGRIGAVGTSLAVAALVGAITLAVAYPGRGWAPDPVGPAGPSGGGLSLPPPPPDWVRYSSLGLVIAVPGRWAINNYGCGMDGTPSIVRAMGAARQCLTPEPTTKNVAIIGPSPDRAYGDLLRYRVSIDGVPASRIEWRLPDGRYAGSLAIASRQIYLDVRTTDEAARQTILDSAHLVDVDHVGCPTARPPVTPPAPGMAGLIPASPTSVQVCYYGQRERLQASTDLSAGDVARLSAEIDAAVPGRNPDVSPDECISPPPQPDVVLHVNGSDGRTTPLWMTFADCTGRGLDNGAMVVRISSAMIGAVMGPLQTGYSYNPVD